MTVLEARDDAVRHATSVATGRRARFAGRIRGDGTAARRARYVRRSILIDAVAAGLVGPVGYLGHFGQCQLTATRASDRRFLLMSGLTGRWQVSGGSDLSWDDSVRIDICYVENWSLTYDFMILVKTAGAVLRGSGAY